MQKRVYYYDRLRILSAVAVVLIHICGAELFRHGLGTCAWKMCNILDSFSRFAVPVFIMLSGALFLNPEKKVDIKSLYGKTLLRIVISFLFWSIVYAVVDYNGNVTDFVKNILLGHYHLYFLFIIAALYVAVPVYRKICEDEKIMRYFLILCLVFTFLLPVAAKLPHMSVIADMLDKAKFNLVTGYSAYFVGGYYLSRMELSKKRRWIIYLIGALAFIATALFTRNASIQSGSFCDEYYSYFSGNVLVQAVAVFVFGKYQLNFKPESQNRKKFLATVSELTFGIYLSHILVLDVLRTWQSLKSLSSVPAYLILLLLLTLLISGIISYILNRIPVVKKYIV